jgi:LacI family transcriptional regulator
VSTPVTLAQIAARAGVHISTASRSLSPDGGGVSSRTAARVRAIAKEMGYQPDPAAATLRTGRSGVLGIVVPRVTDYVLARIFEGADAAARELGFTTVVANTNDDPRLRMQLMEDLLSRRVEGFIIGDARLDGDELVSALKRRSSPYVLVSRRLRGHPSVATDDVRGGQLAGDHLLELGHTAVGVIAGYDYASTCVERAHGFVQRFRVAGIPVPDTCVQVSGADAEGGYQAAHALLTRHPELTALFAINDFAAIGAMGAAREHGRTPGGDIAIVGYNDIPLSQYLPVPLTSVRSSMEQIGREAARALTKLIGGREAIATLLEPVLVARDSTLAVRVS